MLIPLAAVLVVASLAMVQGTVSRSRSDRGAYLPIDWSLLSTVGAAEGAGPNTLGLVGDIALGDKGRIVVLDVAAKRVGVFAPGGQPVYQVGREGRGPGEFFGPVALAMHPRGRLYVLDRVNRRVEVFEAGNGIRVGSFQLSLPAEDFCFVGDRLFLLGALDGRLVHEASPADGEILRSFAPDAESSDPLLTSYRAGGYLACGPGDEVIFLPLLRPELTRFQASTGSRLGTAVIPGYRAVKVYQNEKGGVVFEALQGRSHDYASSIIPLAGGDHLVQVGPIRAGATTRHEFQSIRSFVVSWRNGTVRESPGEAPRLMYARNDTALAVLASPHPAVWMVELQPSVRRPPHD